MDLSFKPEYEEFYKSLTKDWEEPLNYVPFSLEGSVEAKGILYIPKRAPMDLFQKVMTLFNQISKIVSN